MSHDFIEIIKERGFLHQMTDEDGLRALLKTPGQTAYIGFDCTAKSLHVGSLLQIMLLRWWQKCGHKPIVLLGGGTTKIGDPSGKDESRPPLTDAQINENMQSLKQVFSKFIDFDNALMVNNDDWLKDLNYAQFLREYGRHFSINRMLTMDSVKLRLERDQPLSFLEFNYMILQAYDFVQLSKSHQCYVQMGGSDQWGNIINGIELNRRINFEAARRDGIMITQSFTVNADFSAMKKEAEKMQDDVADSKGKLFGITSPLLTTSSGAKMGKTAAGAVWLNADLLSPYDYWQFWRNTEDGDVIRFLKLFTELPLAQIAEYESWLGSSKINDAKIILATEATAMLHGRADADKAAKTAADTFSGAGVSENLETVYITQAELDAGGALIMSYFGVAGWEMSNGDIKRLIKGGGVRLNDVVVTDEKARMTQADFKQGFAKLSNGKKRHVLVKIS